MRGAPFHFGSFFSRSPWLLCKGLGTQLYTFILVFMQKCVRDMVVVVRYRMEWSNQKKVPPVMCWQERQAHLLPFQSRVLRVPTMRINNGDCMLASYELENLAWQSGVMLLSYSLRSRSPTRSARWIRLQESIQNKRDPQQTCIQCIRASRIKLYLITNEKSRYR